ncbi:MAG: SRPBCC family protein [Halioglobus sp.]|nr:SRPBCC family protein [Halioglobus sp.]
MTAATYECEKVELDFFSSAPIRIVSSVDLPCTPERLFRCFEDADAWAQWVGVIKRVEWTSPPPFSVGTTRSVAMPGGMVAYEEFLAWDAPRHMAFRFNQFTQQFLKAFGENYEVTDLGDGRCRLVWTVAMDPAGPPGLVGPILKPFLKLNLGKIMRDLKKYMEKHGE